jgi:iron(III)-salmochelin esterase
VQGGRCVRLSKQLLFVGFVTAFVMATGLVAVAQVRVLDAPRPSSMEERLWTFANSPIGSTRVGVLVPRGMTPGQRLPLLVAFHGWGESARGVERGVWGWAHDYELGASHGELLRSPLRREAFLGFVESSRFRRLRDDLVGRRYEGLVVVTPYTPNVMGEGGSALSVAYGDWVARVVVARARAELPVRSGRESTGVDGVSLGGLLALETGFRNPETYGVVSALQPAVNGRIERVMSAYQMSPSRPVQTIRLVGSRTDWLTRHIRQLDQVLRARHIVHELRVVEGPHDYVFNRGAGGIEMLLFHDRALRGLRAE